MYPSPFGFWTIFLAVYCEAPRWPQEVQLVLQDGLNSMGFMIQGERWDTVRMQWLKMSIICIGDGVPLSICLERYGILPQEISYGIMQDVALGLCFLHERSPPIIHNDLSANNVLLTSNMNAKLSDLGVAKILNLTPARMTQMTQTKAPGTPCYMPPEALTTKPKYTTKIDVYSYGVLIIHTLCGR